MVPRTSRATAIDRAARSAIAVGEVVRGQVLPQDQHITRRDLASGAADLLATDAAGDPQVTAGAKVEVDDVAPAMGEHHDVLRRAGRDPVGDEPRQCLRVAELDGDAVVLRVGSEGCSRIAVAQSGGRTAFPFADLTAVLGELDCWATARERAERAAGIDRIQLAVIADEHELAVGGVDRPRERFLMLNGLARGMPLKTGEFYKVITE